MIDVCFSDSMKGALRYAQKCGDKLSGATATAVFSKDKLDLSQRQKALKKAKDERRELQKQAISLGGSTDDVVGLSFDFSYGDIAAPLDLEDCPRKQIIYEWMTANPWGDLDEMKASFERFWKNCLTDLEKLRNRASEGETIRIWVDETPAAACGLLFSADLLRDLNCQIFIVPLPQQYIDSKGRTVRYCSWSEVAPELFGSFLNNAKVLSKERLQLLAEEWKKLQIENAPLRVVEDSHVISANADYYDDFIREEYPEGSCKVAKLIGQVLGRHCPGISDWLIAERILVLISKNELKICEEDPERFYSSVITCVSDSNS